MEINYELAHEDYWNYRKYRMAHDFLYFPMRFVCLYTFFFCIGYAFHRDLALIAAASFVPAFFHFVRHLLTTKSQIKKLISRYPYWIMPQTLCLGEEGVDWVIDGGKVRVFWRQFKAVEDNGAYLLFRMRRWRAIIVPKEAFVSPYESQVFLELAQLYWQSASSGSKRPSPEGVWPPPPRIGT